MQIYSQRVSLPSSRMRKHLKIQLAGILNRALLSPPERSHVSQAFKVRGCDQPLNAVLLVCEYVRSTEPFNLTTKCSTSSNIKVCSQHMNQTELNWSSRTEEHAFRSKCLRRTNYWATTALVSLQPIKSYNADARGQWTCRVTGSTCRRSVQFSLCTTSKHIYRIALPR